MAERDTKWKVAFKTLGCRLNQSETDAIANTFHRAGYRIVDFTDKADIYIINTCTVTGQSDSKSRNLVSQAVRKKDKPLVVVMGCMVNRYGDAVSTSIPADYHIKNDRKTSVFTLADAHMKGEVVSPELYEPDVFNYTPADFTFHTRSLVKIQDGCNNFCSFCIVPFVRGRAASRPVTDIIGNISQVLDYGYREAVLTGVNIGRYLYDGVNFEGLVEKILNINRDFRLRISSMEPEGLGDRFISLLANPKLMPHLHLCLQSGSDRILHSMHRKYTIKDYLSLIGKIRSVCPGFNLTTDILVGFPGETEEDFLLSCQAAREVGFSHIHTFKYSRREGTRAAGMPGQVPEKVKNQRSRIIRGISVENKRKYREELLGRTQQVLVEKVRGNQGWGYGELYVPVVFTYGGIKKNMLQNVRLVELGEGDDPVFTGIPCQNA
jgi:threonylcarbamoyladenosine tRNA methylthiotransferase MtaB